MKPFLSLLFVSALLFILSQKAEAAVVHKEALNKSKHSNKDFHSTMISSTWVYMSCADGSTEAVGLLTTISNTVGGQTVTTYIFTARTPSIGCISAVM